MNLEALSLDPIAPPALLAVGFILLAGIAVARIVRGDGSRLGWTLRLVMVLLLLLVCLRPVIPGSTAGPSAVGGLEVYYVVDTTSSMTAEDAAVSPGGGTAPDTGTPPDTGTSTREATPPTRLDAVATDIDAITAALGGAQFSLTTFDSSALQRVPLTSDATALTSATSVLTGEITYYSRGSSISQPVAFLSGLLADAQAAHPDRRRVLFYFGDGEQTRDEAPESFAPLTAYIGGGAVLGYGTDDGGRMRIFDGYSADDDPAATAYIQDPGTGADALSRIDDENLRSIASQLGVAYRQGGASGAAEIVAGIDVGTPTTEAGRRSGPVEFYWLFAVPLALLAVREIVVVGRAVVALRPGRVAR